MNYIEAVKLAEQGKKIRRSCWIDSEYIKCNQELNGKYELVDIENEEYMPYTYAILATDWEIYEEKPFKTYNFQEAFSELNRGKIIKRLSNQITFCKHSNFEWISRDPETKTIGTNFYGYNIEIFSYDDLLAKDWIIIDE